MASDNSKRIVIIGSGPCGLGAAYRLHELGHENFVVLEAGATPGGLACSVVDENGFTWDMGGHVVFSHYKYFDLVLDDVCQDWCQHQREAWCWMRDRFIPYPFQNNIHRLPQDELQSCLNGLLQVERTRGSQPKPKNFHEWLENGFGPGIMETFLTPYNRKVWGYDPSEMNVEWMGERVATVDLGRVLGNVITGRDDVSWGPNATFRFPLRNGTGEIWNGVYKAVPSERFRFNAKVVAVDADAKEVVLEDGSRERYDALISTMPLDYLCTVIRGEGTQWMAAKAPEMKYSTTHVVGIGLEGVPPKKLRDKCWMYFPEDDCPFYRVTLFSKYAPYHVPKPGKQWSLMAEICESPNRPVNPETIVEETIQGMLNCKLISPSDKIVDRFHTSLEHGYPTPFLGRDQLMKPIFEALEQRQIYSRGRFGAWKYEVSNQDHTMMQGVECVDHILFGSEETTFRFPSVVNSGTWKDVGRVPRAAPKEVRYHDCEAIVREIVANEERNAADSFAPVQMNEGYTILAMGQPANSGTNIEGKQVVMIDLEKIRQNAEVAKKAMEEMLADNLEVVIVCQPPMDKFAEEAAAGVQWTQDNLGVSFKERVIVSVDKTTIAADIYIGDDEPTGRSQPAWRKAALADLREWRSVCYPRVPRCLPADLYPTGINFSCVFPMFNQEEIVCKVLAGLCKQKIRSNFKFEVVIVDNNSTDDVQAIYMKYRDKLDLRLVQRRKLENTFSVPSARNMGIQVAKYDYIIGMDSDVILHEYFLENMYQFLSSQPRNVPYIVTAERWFVATEDFTDDQILEDYSICHRFPRILSKANYFKPRDNRFSHGNIIENINNGVHPWAYFYGMHTAFPKKVWEAIGGYNEVYDGWWGYDDIHFAYEMITKGGCVPVVLGGTEVYHQEPYGSQWVPVGGVVDKLGTNNPRLNKAANPNWQRICETIPGYAEWKKEHYQKLAGDIVTL